MLGVAQLGSAMGQILAVLYTVSMFAASWLYCRQLIVYLV